MGEHVGILGSERAIRDMLSADLRDLDTRRFIAGKPPQCPRTDPDLESPPGR